MPLWATPLPIRGSPENSDSSGNGNWFTTLGGVLDGYRSRSAAFDLAKQAAPPRDNPNSPGGLAGRIAALAGINPLNPTQPAPPPLDDELRGFYRDDPMQPWFLQGQR
jgi:hypothetical protein